MKLLPRLLLTGIFHCVFILAFAKNEKPKLAPQPMWVTPIAVDYRNTAMDNEAEDGYADLHFETQVSLAQQAVFYRKSFRVLSEAGVENLSQVSVEYDPAFQSLSFHNITIVRNGKSINHLDLSRIKTIQQEKELDRHIYDGSLTAVLFLEDLRKGDVLEYSYTLTGFNPIFQNKYANIFATQFPVAIYSVYYKVLVPAGRTLTVANSLTDIQPRISTSATESAYEWTISNSSAVHVESSLPSWYDAYPMIMVSEYKSWKEINVWALLMFPATPNLSPALQQKVDELKRRYTTPEERVLGALRFVQDDVRYMGIEMGESSHRPHAPAQVLQQRFGDCKDKAYLLCTLLQAMNIEAHPVFINTTYKKTVTAWLPSPTAFDHTTVCAIVNGKRYWFDATTSQQRGTLNDISYPNYQIGLVIAPGTTGFTDISLQNRGKVFSRERFVVDRVGGPARLLVTTEFSGSFADNARYDFQSNSVREILKQYKDLYTPYFKKIDADSLRYKDNEATGVFTTTEYYTVHDFWKSDAGRYTVSMAPYLVNSVMKKPDDGRRRMPFALSYPADYEEEIEVEMPKEWSIQPSEVHASAPSFTLDCKYIQATPNTLLLKYHYRSLADHVAPNDMADYIAEIETAENGMGFGLSDDISATTDTGRNSKPAPANGFTLAYLILGIAAFFTFLYKKTRS